MSLFNRFSNTKFFLKPTLSAIVNNLLEKNNILNIRYRFYAKKSFILNSKSENVNNSITSTEENKHLNEPKNSYLEEVLLKHEDKPKTPFQKVKRGVENTFFYSIGVISFAALAGLGYYLFDFFWAKDSPQRIYTNALKFIRDDVRCKNLFGSQIAAYGETSSRGRRRHIANKRYMKDDEERIRVVFYIKGEKKKGKATVEMANVDGIWDYRFLLVETDGINQDSILLIDNKKKII